MSSRRTATETLTDASFARNIVFQAFLCCSVERHTFAELVLRLRRSFVQLQLNGWKFWPAVALANYTTVPPSLRPLSSNIAALAWATYLVRRR